MGDVIPLDRFRRAIKRARNSSDAFLELRPLLDDLGIAFIARDLGAEDGYAFFSRPMSKSGFVIVVNSRHSRRQQRLAAAHELGHCILHPEYVKSRSQDGHFQTVNSLGLTKVGGGLGDFTFDPLFDDPTANIEREARRFADNLLMPIELVRDLRRRGIWRAEELAARFGVSKEDMWRRIDEMKGPNRH